MRRRDFRALAALTAVASFTIATAVAAQEPTLTVRGPIRGRVATILSEAAAAPYHLIDTPSKRVDIKRDTTISSTLIVLGSRTTVAGAVQGDVIVVNGDLFLHPGARISGRVIAIGGGVYNSMLAKFGGGGESFPDAAVVVDTTATGIELEDLGERKSRADLISFPLLYGVRIPEYDRVDGLSFAFGPRITVADGRFVVDPIATYRSALGVVDGHALTTLRVGRSWSFESDGGRGTLTNDRWIQTDISNSLSSIWNGNDYRNYFRSDYAIGRLAYLWQTTGADIRVWAGARHERDWSVGLGDVWTFLDRHDTINGPLRPNPSVSEGHLSSALGGGEIQWDAQGVRASLRAEVEVPWSAPGNARFQQTTIQAHVGFPTFGDQRLDVFSHAVLTSGDTAPPQRFAYLGGSGTIPTMSILSRGGDQLLFFAGDYTIPITRIVLPFVGSPTVTLRELIGAAGVGRLGDFDQNIGLRVAIAILRGDFYVDPRSHATTGGVGISLIR